MHSKVRALVGTKLPYTCHKTYLTSTAEERSPKDRSDTGELTKLMHT